MNGWQTGYAIAMGVTPSYRTVVSTYFILKSQLFLLASNVRTYSTKYNIGISQFMINVVYSSTIPSLVVVWCTDGERTVGWDRI